MIEKLKEKGYPISIGALFTLLMALLLYLSPGFLGRSLSFLENISYTLMLRNKYKPIDAKTPIAIVDIDDRSLVQIGRWPWPRDKMGELVDALFKLKAKAIAFDFMFPEAEGNLADVAIRRLKEVAPQSSVAFAELESAKSAFDNDEVFAKALSSGDTILGFVLLNEGNPFGALPPPLMTLSEELREELYLPDMKSYIGNYPPLQKAAKGGAFINATPDPDGVIRFSPMLLRMGSSVYPSLSLGAVQLFLGNEAVQLQIERYGRQHVLEGIKIGNKTIPTDPWGRILIPFRGPPYSVPYISAADLFSGQVSDAQVANKLLFIGSSATAMGDLVATAMAPIFAGIEIHAQIASGILDDYLPYKPAWGKGVAIALILILGLVSASLLPFLGPIEASAYIFSLCFALIGSEYLIWTRFGIVLTSIFPLFSLLVLYVFNIVLGYFFETGRRKLMKSVFGQYVPPDCIDSMIKKGGGFGMEGESKELTVLFADIRGFTTLSEKLTASELKKLLNDFLTPMTAVIFENKGTIDKYVGDMVMAFWGAPLEDAAHASHAVQAALQMQKKLGEINSVFQKNKLPEIRIGIGVNTGVMDVGDMGSQFRRAYTVLGDAVNLGSRLEGITKIYNAGIIVGEKTKEKTGSEFVYRKIDKVRVKGKELSIAIYEPLCKTGECDQQTMQRLVVHDHGLDAYAHQQWDEAERLFKQLLESDPNKGLYQLYLSRIAEYRTTPPSPDWDGTFVLESK
jgi:adenylate cyclase